MISHERERHSQSNLFSFLDNISREEFQISATDFKKWGLSEEDFVTLTFSRFLLRTSSLLSAASLWLTSEGLRQLHSDGLTLFILGIILSRVSYQLERSAKNKAGSVVFSFIQKVLSDVEPHLDLIHDLLYQQKLTKSQINQIKSLTGRLYDAELTAASFHERNVLPATAGIWLASHQMFWESIATIGLWRFYDWSGKRAKKESGITRKSNRELALSAKNYQHLRKLGEDHLKMVASLGLRQELRHMLFIISALTNQDLPSVLGSFRAINSGLSPTDSALNAARSIDEDKDAQEVTRALLTARKNIIVNQKDWNRHRAGRNNTSPSFNVPNTGVALRNFNGTLPSGERLFSEPLNLDLHPGTITAIKTKSGDGKSILMQEIAQVITAQESGSVFFISGTEVVNALDIPELSQVRKTIFFPELFAKSQASLGLIDILKPFFLLSEHKVVEELAANLAKQGVDENTIHNCIHGAYNQLNAVVQQHSPEVVSLIEQFKQSQLTWAKNIVLSSGGNLAIISEELDKRTATTLSAGQTKRFQVLLAHLAAVHFPQTKLILLDEPFAGLDEVADNTSDVTNFTLQNDSLKNINAFRPDIAIFIAEHKQVEDITEVLRR